MLRFASLASGSGGNCLVVEASDAASTTRVLVDCGLTLTDTERRLARAGLQPSDIDAILVTLVNGLGEGSVTFPVPNDTALYRLALYFQWGIVDPGAHALKLAFSEGGKAVIGGL